MVTTKREVLSILTTNQDALEALGVRRYALFGSFLRDEIAPDSDVDLLVEFRPGEKTFRNFSNLIYFLEELLGRRVEVVTSDSLSPHIGPHILREAQYVALGG
jgi:predicted nucleotidyltransferase